MRDGVPRLVPQKAQLKDVIEAALEDGKVDGRELIDITNMLKRVGHTKKTMARVEKALGGAPALFSPCPSVRAPLRAGRAD